MAQLFDFKKVTIGPRALVATVELAPSAPLMTSDDAEATGRVLDLLPSLSDHVCLGDAAPTFGEVAPDTELAHLLEHVAVELLAQTDIAGDVACGQTAQVAERTYEITLGCPDDVLVAAALSSAAWVLQWAFSGGGDPRPDVEAIVGGLVALVASVSDQPGEKNVEQEAPSDEELAAEAEVEPVDEPEPEPELEPEPEAESEPEPESEDAPTQSEWDMDDVPRPHLVR